MFFVSDFLRFSQVWLPFIFLISPNASDVLVPFSSSSLPSSRLPFEYFYHSINKNPSITVVFFKTAVLRSHLIDLSLQ